MQAQASLSPRHLFALLCLASTIFTQTPLHARQAPPQFFPVMEGETWKTAPPHKIGVPPDPPVCFPADHWQGNWQSSMCPPEELIDHPDELNLPIGIAVYEPTPYRIAPVPTGKGFPNERRIFIADRYNHRIVPYVTGAAGTWVPLSHARCIERAENDATKCVTFEPVERNQADYQTEVDAAQWHGFPAGSQWNLQFPEHIAVDRAGHLWVADQHNQRVVIFTPTGQGLATLDSSFSGAGTIDPATGGPYPPIQPYGIALNADGEWGNPSQVNGRATIVAQDYGPQDTHVIVVNAATGTEISRKVGPYGTDPGSFVRGTGVAYHRQVIASPPFYKDRILVADSDNYRVQVFSTNPATGALTVDANGAPEFTFGEDPADTAPLSWTYSVLVDQRGRVLVSDSGNNRLVAFKLVLDNPVPGDPFTPHAEFLFELNADGGLDGSPKGVAEDADGRLYITDTGNHEIEVFEIPALTVVDVALSEVQPQAGAQITVEFSVMIPYPKTALGEVTPTCAVSSGPITFGSGPEAVPGTEPLVNGSYPIEPVGPDGGRVYRYSCSFDVDALATGEFSVVVSAEAAGGTVTAQDKFASGEVAECGTSCEDFTPGISAAIIAEGTGPYTSEFTGDTQYYRGATIRLTADDTPNDETEWSGIARIYWRWDGEPEADEESCETGLDDPDVRCSAEFTTPAEEQFVDVPAQRSGEPRRIWFWTVDHSGNFSDEGSLEITIDTVPPDIEGGRSTISPTGQAKPIPATPEEPATEEFWWNGDVTMTYVYHDNMVPDEAVTLIPDQRLESGEPYVLIGAGGEQGRGLYTTWRVIDVAQNGADHGDGTDPPVDSRDVLFGGTFNIDRVAPTTEATANGSPLTDDQIFTAGPTITLSGTDPLHQGVALSGLKKTFYKLDNGGETEYAGPIEVGDEDWGAHTIEIWSTDWAGNAATPTVLDFYVNDVPDGVDDSDTTPEDTTKDIDVLLNDVDENDRAEDPLTIVLLSSQSAAGGSISVVSGEVRYEVRYTPPLNFAGTDTFKYQVADSHMGVSGDVDVTVDVINRNDPPTAVNDVVTATEDVAAIFDVVANDTDPDSGDTLTISPLGFTQPAHGTVTLTVDNKFRYEPFANYSGPDAFTYTVQDSSLAQSNAARVSITVAAANDQVTAGNDQSATPEDTSVQINVTTNDSSDDGGLTYVSATNGANGTVTPRLGGTGTYTYTPNPNFFGTDSFTYTVRDAFGGDTATATVTIQVLPVNDAPVAVDDRAFTPPGMAVTIAVLDNDSDVDSPRSEWTVLVTSPASHGTTFVNLNGTVTYTPAPGHVGPDSFKYTVTDNGAPPATSREATVSITTNNPPGCGKAYAFPGEIWPPNHKQINVVIRGVTDPNGDAFTIRIDRILQDEPTNTNGDGNTWIDGGGIGTSTAWVRAERMGPENDRRYNNGRVYEIFFTATDVHGGECSSKVTVGVPHDQGKGKPPIDNGCRWDSTVKNGPVLYCAPGSQPPVAGKK